MGQHSSCLGKDALMHFLKEEHLTGDERWRPGERDVGGWSLESARRFQWDLVCSGVPSARREWIQSRRSTSGSFHRYLGSKRSIVGVGF